MVAIAMIFACVWFLIYDANMLLLVLEAYSDTNKDDPNFGSFLHGYDYLGLFLILFFIVMCCNPFDCFYKEARK